MIAGAGTRVFVEDVMGTVASIHVRGRSVASAFVDRAVAEAIDRLRDDERVFSTYDEASDVSLLRRGSRRLEDADPRVADVWERCIALRERTAGLFDAWQRGWFDPTGLVKGWSVERAARAVLEPLVHEAGIDAAGITVGGDLQVFTAPGIDQAWRIGIADPRRRDRLLATVDVVDGAVATSGTAERGGHLTDPRTGRAVTAAVGATVIADSLTIADPWATAAAIAGVHDLTWLDHAPACSGLISDGSTTRRWAAGVEVVVASVPASA